MKRPRIFHAVVIGAGVGGLAAAKALAPHADMVTIIDRGSTSGQNRGGGVRQAAHAHSLCSVGINALDRLFVGLPAELVRSGAVLVDACRDALVWQAGAYLPRFTTGIRQIYCTRLLLDLLLRRRLEEDPSVKLRYGTAVSGLVARAGRVVGVRLSTGENLPAEIVVDATGRRRRVSDRWLVAADLPEPVSHETNDPVDYEAHYFKRSDARRNPALVFAGSLGYFAFATAVEAQRWIVTVGHRGRRAAGTTIFDAISALPTDDIERITENNEPVGTVMPYRFSGSRWRRLDLLEHCPEGYICVGDALASLSPTRGLGVTLALLQALALGRLVDRRSSLRSLTTDYYRHCAKRLIGPQWDYQAQQTGWYATQTERAALQSMYVLTRTLQVENMIKSPRGLVHPSVAARVLWSAARGQRRVPSPVSQ